VCQKIPGVVVAGIEVIFVFHAFCLKLPTEFRGSLLESEFIVPAAVEIDRQPSISYPCPVRTTSTDALRSRLCRHSPIYYQK
jgi:hypothetical protein